MKIEAADIIVNRSSLLEIGSEDEVRACLIYVQDSRVGAVHPIRIKAGAVFDRNVVESQIKDPILLDPKLDEGFLDTHQNIIRILRIDDT